MNNAIKVAIIALLAIGALQWFRVSAPLNTAQTANPPTSVPPTKVYYLSERDAKGLSIIANAMALAAPLKAAATAYLASHDELATSNAQVGFPKPGKYTNRFIRSAGITASGDILVILNKSSGFEGASITLRPEENQHAMLIEWSCFSTNIKGLESVMQCPYRPAD